MLKLLSISTLILFLATSCSDDFEIKKDKLSDGQDIVLTDNIDNINITNQKEKANSISNLVDKLVLKKKCATCHTKEYIAKNSSLIFTKDSVDGGSNIEVLNTYLKTAKTNDEKVKAKALGELNHGGSKILQEDELEYKLLKSYIDSRKTKDETIDNTNSTSNDNNVEVKDSLKFVTDKLVVKQMCVTCHSADGIAKTTPLIFRDDVVSGTTNIDVLVKYINNDKQKYDRLLNKATGSVNHYGKDVLKVDTLEYNIFESFSSSQLRDTNANSNNQNNENNASNTTSTNNENDTSNTDNTNDDMIEVDQNNKDFKTILDKDVLKSDCLACHSTNGFAKGTTLVFEANFEDGGKNIEILSNFIKAKSSNYNLLLNKASGSVEHLGATPLPKTETGYKLLKEYADTQKIVEVDVVLTDAILDKDVLKESCVVCHNADGIAKGTNLILKSSSVDGKDNIATLSSFLKASDDRYEILLSKASGSVDHFGGEVLKKDSAEFELLKSYAATQVDVSVDNSGNTDTTENNTGDNTNTDNTDSTNNTNTDTEVVQSNPVITLLGEEFITITQGTTYIEPGVSSKDYLGHDINVSINGSVNKDVPGKYTLQYSAKDFKGNSSTITRLVTVEPSVSYVSYRDGLGSFVAGSEVEHKGKVYKCKVPGWCNLDHIAYVPGEGFGWTSAWDEVGEAQASVENTLPSAPKLLDASYSFSNSSIDITWDTLSKNTQKVKVLINAEFKKEVAGYLSTSASVSGEFKQGVTYNISLIAINDSGEAVSNILQVTPQSLVNLGKENYSKNCKVCHGVNGLNKANLTLWDQVKAFSAWTKDSNMPASYTSSCDTECLDTIGVYVKDVLIPRSKEEKPAVALDVKSQIKRGYRLLNSIEYKNTLESLFNQEVDISKMPLDNLVDGYNSDRNLNRVDEDKLKFFNAKAYEYEKYFNNLKNSSGSKCIVGGYDFCEADKIKFLNTFARKIFRRDLSSAEKTEYAKLLSLGEIIGNMIVSPKFLYRTEMGTYSDSEKAYVLTQYEIATALSYAISGTTPDDELLDLAKNNKLLDSNVRITQAVRLSKLETGKRKLEDFIGRWLLHDDIHSLADKNPSKFPGYDQDVRDAQSAQIAEFFRMVISDVDNSTYKDLFINNKWVTNKVLSDFYGEKTSQNNDFEIINATDKRFGLLTLGAVASKYANSEEGHPFKRGNFILSRMMCHPMGLPGNGGDVPSVKEHINENTRDRYSTHVSDPSCAACHNMIDPIGFVWEKYDGAGRFRLQELHPDGAKDIDTAVTLKGVLTFNTSEAKEASSVMDLSSLISTSDRGPKCMAMQYYRYISGDSLAQIENNPVIDKIASDFKNENYDLQSLFNNIVGLKSFITREAK